MIRAFVLALAAAGLAATPSLAQDPDADVDADADAADEPVFVCPSPPDDDTIDFGAPEEVRIRTADGTEHVFQAEIADEQPEHARGLMFRASLADDAGMLFDFGDERPHRMWMRNTCVSLDILFVERDGVISGIAAHAPAMSDRTAPSPGPVRGVFEIAAGRAAALGVAPGDRVIHPRFPAPIVEPEPAADPDPDTPSDTAADAPTDASTDADPDPAPETDPAASDDG